jgi:hypothetical protein
MATAQNSRRQYAFIAEATYGTTPATPQTQLIEVVSFDADLQAEQLNSATIRADRQIGFSRRGNLGVEGTLEIELVPDNFDWAIEAVLGGTWTAGVVKVGNTERSFSIEEGFTDLPEYRVFNGVVVNTMSMEVTPTALVTASFGLIGKGTSALSGTSIDSTPTAITKKDVFYHDGGTISEGGSPIAYVTAISFDVTNNMVGNYAIGNTSYRSVSQGRVEITGTLTAMFEDEVLYNKFKNSTTSQISFTLSAGSPAETLTFAFPDVRYTTGTITRADTGPVLVALGFTAVYDSASASTIVVTRA